MYTKPAISRTLCSLKIHSNQQNVGKIEMMWDSHQVYGKFERGHREKENVYTKRNTKITVWSGAFTLWFYSKRTKDNNNNDKKQTT